MVEKLENRLFMDAAITGGPGHAGFVVDVRNENGAIIGVMAIDYYAAGFFGENPGTDGSSDGGDPVTGSTGRIRVDYTPNTTVQQRVGTINPNAIIKGDAAADERVEQFIEDVTNNFVNFDEIAGNGENYEDRVNAYGDYETYYVWDENCYHFADKLLSLEANTTFGDSSTWEGLQADLVSAQKYLHNQTRIFRKPLPVFESVVKTVKDIKEAQQ